MTTIIFKNGFNRRYVNAENFDIMYNSAEDMYMLQISSDLYFYIHPDMISEFVEECDATVLYNHKIEIQYTMMEDEFKHCKLVTDFHVRRG